MLRGMRVTKDAVQTCDAEMVHAVPEAGVKATATKCNNVWGGYIQQNWDPRNVNDTYKDEYTTGFHSPELFRAAMIFELEYYNSRVWEVCGLPAITSRCDLGGYCATKVMLHTPSCERAS